MASTQSEPQVFENSAEHHKVFYKSHCVTNAQSSTAALTTVEATEGDLFNSLNAFGATLKLSSQLIGSTVYTTLEPLVPITCVGTCEGTDGQQSHLGPHRRPSQNQRKRTSACRAGETGPGRRWF